MKNLFLLLSIVVANSAYAQHINTIAGTGTAGFSGDGGAATAAHISGPFGICTDLSGNIYFADRGNSRIRRIDNSGNIVTVAGTGVAGYNGDNIDPVAAQLNDPVGIVAHVWGPVYVADKGNNRIRSFVPLVSDIITIAGTGSAGYSGNNGPATAATFNQPRDIAIDTFGNLYIADQGNNCIRKITAATGIISTIAGNGTLGYSGDNGPATAARLNGPYSVAVDYTGNVYIADVDNQRIRKVSTSGIITTVAGTGTTVYNGDNMPATSANLNEPICVRVDIQGNIYIADAWHSCIRKINTAGIITTIVGNGIAGYSGDNGPATDCELNNPYGIALDNAFTLDMSIYGYLLMSDNANNRIRRTYTAGVGMAGEMNIPAVTIFPNPSADGRFTLDLSSLGGKDATIKVVDILGREVYKKQVLAGSPIDIQLSSPSGIYALVINQHNNSYTKRIVIGE